MASAKKKTEKPGTMIRCGQKAYIVENLLGRGGFGDVYKVHVDSDKSQVFAMKTESNDVQGASLARLKVETSVYADIQSLQSVDKTQFLQMHDKGKTSAFKFIVMDLAGRSLKDVVQKLLKDKLSAGTQVTLARQTLKAVEVLHNLGWIHRDIKPANFSIGVPPKEDVVYMLDFGTCRKYREADGRLRIPRKNTAAPATIFYCSIRCHEKLEQGRRDDLETWMYMTIEFYWPGNTWWTSSKDIKEVIESKKSVLERPLELLNSGKLRLSEKFVKIIEMINKMTYTDAGDFAQINRILDIVAVDTKADMKQPLDWIGKAWPEEPKKQKAPEVREPSPVKKNEKEDNEEVIERRKDLEKQLSEIYEDMGEPKSAEWIRAKVLSMAVKAKVTRELELDRDEDSEGEYSREDRKHRRRKQSDRDVSFTGKKNRKRSDQRRGRGRKHRSPKGEERDRDRDRKYVSKYDEVADEKTEDVKPRDAEKKCDEQEKKKPPDAKKD